MQRKTSAFLVMFLLFSYMSVFAANRPVEMISQRIIIEGRGRSAVVKLLNRNPEAITYRIETIMLRQNLSGGTEMVEEPTTEEQKILKMIRFSPRQVRIKSNSVQTVRIMARKPANLPDGEYRAHMKATPIPDPEKESGSSEGAEVKIDLIISLSFPIIIRHGETNVELDAAKVTPEAMQDGKKGLKVRIIADGNRSAYIDAELYHGETLIGERKAFAVYQPNGKRDIVIPLKKELPNSGTDLRLILRDREKDDLPLIREIPIKLEY
ncbi:MAG: hypothetical protein ACQESS_12080 [Bacillota bacterium]